jgi:hypothetical protein
MHKLYEMIEYYKNLKNNNPHNREAERWFNIYLKEKKRLIYKYKTTIKFLLQKKKIENNIL